MIKMFIFLGIQTAGTENDFSVDIKLNNETCTCTAIALWVVLGIHQNSFGFEANPSLNFHNKIPGNISQNIASVVQRRVCLKSAQPKWTKTLMELS